jgi:DNA-directed RNA polymerase specialized sigma24 family protein
MDVNNSDLEEDGKLLQLMIAGEERGFVSLYQKYQSRVYRFSLQIGGTQQLAEEVTQETFLAVIRAPHKYEATRGPLLLYLFGIARNLAWKSMRRDRLLRFLGIIKSGMRLNLLYRHSRPSNAFALCARRSLGPALTRVTSHPKCHVLLSF